MIVCVFALTTFHVKFLFCDNYKIVGFYGEISHSNFSGVLARPFVIRVQKNRILKLYDLFFIFQFF